MNKRVLAVLVALVLAVLGVLMLVVYTGNADRRAMDDAELIDVIQVKKSIAAGSSVDDLQNSVEKVRLPRKSVVKGAIGDLGQIKGLSATTALEPGEQLIRSRFAKDGLAVTKDEASVPRGLQEVTLALTAERVSGGVLAPGDRVGVARSYGASGGVTELRLSQILVTRVQAPPAEDAGRIGSGGAAVIYLVTLAVSQADAASIINAVEFGKVYLTKQNEFSQTPAVLVKALDAA